MIPKKILFNWFGNKIPDYVYFCIENFKKVNKNFDILFTHKTIDYLEDIYNTKNLNVLNSEDLEWYKYIQDSIIDIIKEKNNVRPFLTAFNDYYRIKQLNTIGGIYLDCDMFPIKPFDDNLLKLEYFCMCRQFPTQIHITLENGFSGKNPNYNGTYKILSMIMEDQKKTIELQDKFYNLSLKYGEYYGDPKYNYVDHYSKYTWNPKKCLLNCTSMDKYILQKMNKKINFVKIGE